MNSVDTVIYKDRDGSKPPARDGGSSAARESGETRARAIVRLQNEGLLSEDFVDVNP